jgi:hemoglobin
MMVDSDPRCLWDQLGGDAKMKLIVQDFVNAAIRDPEVNYNRNGRYRLDEQSVENTRVGALEFFSCAIGGPHHYTGKSIVDSHRNMEITGNAFTSENTFEFLSNREVEKIDDALSIGDSISLQIVGDELRWRVLCAGFAIGQCEYDPDFKSQLSFAVVPYWFIVIPLTAFSAYLLLSNRRLSTAKKPTELTSEKQLFNKNHFQGLGK